MYRLMRSEGLRHSPALLGALAFEALPKLFAHYGAGHVTLIYAVAWTPWLLCSVEGLRLKVEGSRSNFQPSTFNIKPSVVLALIFLADPRWAVYAGGAWWLYGIAQSYSAQKKPSAAVKLLDVQRLQLLGKTSFRLLFQTVLAAMLAAPLALPLLELTRLSTRAHLSPAEVLTFSLPPARMLGLIFPSFGGFHEWTLYPGAAVFSLAVLSVFWRGSLGRYWRWLAGLSLLFAVGEYLPLPPVLGAVPGLSLLRVPSRALFLTGLSLAALAAAAVDRFFTITPAAVARRSKLLLVGLLGFALALAGSIWTLTGKLPLEFAWGTGVLLSVSVWIWLRMNGHLAAGTWAAGLLALCILDLAPVDLSLFAARPAASVLAESQPEARYLSEQRGSFRVYSPSYSLPQQTAALYGLELANGVDPMQLAAYAGFMARASGVPQQGYSVVLPPVGEGDPSVANHSNRPDPRLLGLLNVRYVAAEYELPVAGLELRERFGETRLYENLLALPRAWVQPLASTPGENAQSEEITTWSPNRIELRVPETDGEADRLLVLSELHYPGWRAEVDGRQAKILPVAGLLRGVALDPGAHRVVFLFRPASLYAGLILCAAGLLIAFAAWHRSSASQTTLRQDAIGLEGKVE
jgi:hypothetical protein